MMRIDRLINQLIDRPATVPFLFIKKILGVFGFELKRVAGSHRIYVNEDGVRWVVPVHGRDCDRRYKRELSIIIKQIYEKKNG